MITRERPEQSVSGRRDPVDLQYTSSQGVIQSIHSLHHVRPRVRRVARYGWLNVIRQFRRQTFDRCSGTFVGIKLGLFIYQIYPKTLSYNIEKKAKNRQETNLGGWGPLSMWVGGVPLACGLCFARYKHVTANQRYTQETGDTPGNRGHTETGDTPGNRGHTRKPGTHLEDRGHNLETGDRQRTLVIGNSKNTLENGVTLETWDALKALNIVDNLTLLCFCL
ncbi:hypothetical protein BaRGS_00033453 [Batillaria attramentaria]|uniref:Uncharacterized protein n=1 Tax=Batillaria attramentaria TaxID=370345 RepID=A0ABD0JKV8_9CAEN